MNKMEASSRGLSNRTLEYHEAHRLIPGGAHTYSKGDDQFPSNAPRYLERGEGTHVWDDDGRRYLDWTMGLRTMTLGYGIAEVDEAAIAQLRRGNNFGRPSRVETELARALVELVPSADMVKFAKNGSSVTTAAVKLARAYTGRPYVCYCKDHPFFSYDDWFIGTTAVPAGVPDRMASYSLAFAYNDLDNLEQQFRDHGDEIACVIMEAATSVEPLPGFLEGVQSMCRRHGAVLIFDEMITGFRWHRQGAQGYYGIEPDLSTFGKGIANGYSVSAVVGRRDIMELGGLFHGGDRVFLMSSTHGAENISLAAALACLKIYEREDVTGHLWRIGQKLMDGLNGEARKAGVSESIVATGFGCNPVIAITGSNGQPDWPLRTIFLQEMVRAGVLINNVTPSFSHTESDVAATLTAAAEAFAVCRAALDDGWERYLEGHVIKPVFRPSN